VGFLEKAGLKVELSIDNLVDAIWTTKPAPPRPLIFVHEEWAGKGIVEKVGWVREKINAKGGNAAIFNDLSEIAWITNLRSSEIPHNPFFKSILVVRKEGGSLYLPKEHPSLSAE
jgi:Xaa-Pro aminopeptidase